jgi:hypothetical protein
MVQLRGQRQGEGCIKERRQKGGGYQQLFWPKYDEVNHVMQQIIVNVHMMLIVAITNLLVDIYPYIVEFGIHLHVYSFLFIVII